MHLLTTLLAQLHMLINPYNDKNVLKFYIFFVHMTKYLDFYVDGGINS